MFSLCLTSAASTTSCRGQVLMDYTSQRKKPLSATSSRLSGKSTYLRLRSESKTSICLRHFPLFVPPYSLFCFALKLFFTLFSFDSPLSLPPDPVIVVWRQRILMMLPPVLRLLANPLRPETTPSGTAAAISQYLHFHIFYIFFTKKIEFLQGAASGSAQRLSRRKSPAYHPRKVQY